MMPSLAARMLVCVGGREGDMLVSGGWVYILNKGHIRTSHFPKEPLLCGISMGNDNYIIMNCPLLGGSNQLDLGQPF